MRLGVVREDNMVYVEGVGRPINCSALPAYIHAIQWYGEAEPPYGEIEFAADKNGVRMPNLRFTDLTPFQYLADDYAVSVETERKALEAVKVQEEKDG